MDLTYEKALEKVDALKTLGQTEVWLHDFTEGQTVYPYEFITAVEAGGSWRLNGPASVRFRATHPSGLSFTWSVDFEERDANGRGVSLFDRDGLRNLISKLPATARQSFADFMEKEVLPGLQKTTKEYRDALNRQLDSEDCVRGLIAFGRQEAEPAQ